MIQNNITLQTHRPPAVIPPKGEQPARTIYSQADYAKLMMKDAKQVAKRTKTKMGRMPTGQSERTEKTKYRNISISAQGAAVLELLKSHPNQSARFYAERVGCGRKSISNAIYNLRCNGLVISKTTARVPLYTLEPETS